MPLISSAQEALKVLGSRLREIRLDARLSGRDLGRATGWHSSKVSKIEYGRQAPSIDDIKAWCEQCGALQQVPDLVASLHAVEGLFVEWRRKERSGLRRSQESRLQLWGRTRSFRIYSSKVVPGPVQTTAYIEAILSAIRVRRDLPDDVDTAVQVRVDKQQVTNDGSRRFAIVLEEAVLRFLIGGPATMAAQLGHLLTVSTLPTISLGVIPLNADRSAIWPQESFWIFDDQEVGVELVTGRLNITQPREIAAYAHVFAELAERAVYGGPARALIAAAISATTS